MACYNLLSLLNASCIVLFMNFLWIDCMSVDCIKISPLLPLQKDLSKAPMTSKPLPAFVDISTLHPTIKTDVRYATADNFIGSAIYKIPGCYLLKKAANDFLAAVKAFERLGYGVVVYDAYRPFSAQQKMFEAYPVDGFVADPRKGGRHTRGMTVDITLYSLATGMPLEMPTEFDSFDLRAAAQATENDGLSAEQYKNKMLLITVMNEHHFTVVKNEWWHFDHENFFDQEPMDYSFEQIATSLNK